MTDKITIDRALLQQALDALKSCSAVPNWPVFAPIRNALREALAAPQPEDDGWLQSGGLLYRLTDERRPCNRDEIRVTMADGERSIEACTQRARELLDRISSDLAPQRQPRPFRKCEDSQAGQSQVLQPEQPAEPVALVCDICGVETQDPWHYSEGNQRHLHACDKCQQIKPAKPAEPVAWISVGGEWGAELLDWEIDPEQQLCDAINEKYVGNPQKLPLYTAPPEQQPLTKAQIKALIVATPEPDDGDVGKWVLSLIRAVEKAHKIGSRP